MRSMRLGWETTLSLLISIIVLSRLPAAAGAVAALNCTSNADHGNVYNTTDASYDILCGIDYVTSNLATHTVATFEGCIALCDAEVLCIDVSYVPSQQQCYIKSHLDTPSNNTDVWTARNRVYDSEEYLTCNNGRSDGIVYNTTIGSSYKILCNVDYFGGDLFNLQKDTFLGCVEACDSTPGCIDISYVQPSCYLKHSTGVASLTKNVWTAKRVKEAPSSSATSSSASSSNMGNTSPVGSTTAAPALSSPVPPTTSSSSSPIKFPTTAPFANTTRSSTTTSTSTPLTHSGVATPTAPTCVDGGSDNTNFTTSAGSVYGIVCGYQHDASVISTAYAADFEGCMEQCDAATNCIDITYVGSYCYMKATVGSLSVAAGAWSATRIKNAGASGLQLSCYNDKTNGTVFTTDQGRPYRIFCGMDLPGGDMATAKANTFESCLNECDKTTNCVDVAYVAPYCYLKTSVAKLVVSQEVWAAMRVS
ncbi:uncharacterized protein E0L32_005831 [Thyridium curvatum]|uniref:Apple domain-containing protein n=1 Tax=Thyridium curvatum TaxID=1093900 RepID=A0A507BA17_9PEZI|nr:uncharacterized protein E0L32_005831 [Thyridium curvatum]TPX13628.1 hypothetical protein E0L32_005831 [Thyridium curvatum]